jgi:hypothetical protein
MSYPTAYVYCDKCDYTNTANLKPAASFYKIFLFNDLFLKDTNGWCNSCNKNVMIENFDNKRKSFIQEQYLKWKADKKIKFIYYFFKNLWWKAQIRNCDNPKRCLNCGSTDIEKIVIPYPEEIDEPLNIGYKHPGCGGNLWVNNDGLRLNSKYYDKRIYTLNGKYIKIIRKRMHG